MWYASKTGRWDHPRVCGEKIWSSTTRRAISGSPPRMRGKGLPGDPVPLRRGITPAYAGKRTGISGTGCWAGDHPRVCGEKFLTDQMCFRVVGSPPRMRGKVTSSGVLLPQVGITPAYAGKSAQIAGGPITTRDHPRVCGEKACASGAHSRQPGSPPRMRGKANQCRRHPPGEGITPAYAGKRKTSTKREWLLWDHPRVCGEKPHWRQVRGRTTGSPPRMRGKGCRRNY